MLARKREPAPPLLHLSLQRVTGLRMPQVPTNEERLAAYRPFMPMQFANATFALSEHERYALNESIDNSTPTTDVHWSQS